jgi:hypothetical protein
LASIPVISVTTTKRNPTFSPIYRSSRITLSNLSSSTKRLRYSTETKYATITKTSPSFHDDGISQLTSHSFDYSPTTTENIDTTNACDYTFRQSTRLSSKKRPPLNELMSYQSSAKKAKEYTWIGDFAQGSGSFVCQCQDMRSRKQDGKPA